MGRGRAGEAGEVVRNEEGERGLQVELQVYDPPPELNTIK